MPSFFAGVGPDFENLGDFLGMFRFNFDFFRGAFSGFQPLRGGEAKAGKKKFAP